MNRADFLRKYPNRMSLEQFEQAAREEKAIDWDGAYGEQCVDLARFYFYCVLGIQQPGGVNGAQDFFYNYPKDKVLQDNFDRIENTLDFVPKRGDVAIWKGNVNNPFGHIAIVLGPSTVKTMTVLEQNYVKHTVTRREDGYNYFLGVLRPKAILDEVR
jgi:hypothetical protein